MTFKTYEDLGQGITRIDTGMIHEGLAALYLVGSEDEWALVETGTQHSIATIMALLQARGIDPMQVKYIIPTHVHLDHAGGVGGLMQRLPQATLLVHPRGARHMIDPAQLKAGATAVYGAEVFQQIYGDLIPVEPHRVRQMQDAEQVTLGNRTLVFYDTPGHARHHFCVHDLQSNGVFSGDTFGLAYPTLNTANGPFIMLSTTPVQFDPQALKNSITKLLSLQPGRMYLTHYGAVDGVPALAEQLLLQVDDYVAIARRVQAQAPLEQWEQRLVGLLTGYTVNRARRHGCTLADDELERILALDMKLNAQGLAVWLASAD
ncbi:MAG: MBL fold metallo-hydrolase [Pseudomonadales bacterium]|jgi:glyoxylase-like metal-dependent hydrolase (beta-lactamase superfamily II)|nr:MBL fold metallo-hydrolase [Pseudomonadales bacterium]MCK5792914.1 MBL fold metallo-hydrolase [Ketobacter sp.]MEC8812286.1 MBL fold metallo-hydrolase [Pseudomonadota bacterium]TNC84132.1 MAG: MBL fold metallo-hydrolase [Alcanivorax sp.]HAG93269.1 MBL fold metallo-hydrolase [Gammaproteobacteria bacterium]|tara:strand:+ start:1531 stop:2487 length:957 start_codon:yes stop_codon:yes gene_type:complete